MNSGVVLVVAPEDDLHVQAVQSVLQRNGVNVVQVETRDFPTTINLTLEWSNTVGASLAFPDGMRVHRDDVLALWWRRQGGYRINDTVRGEAEREYARVTSRYAFESFISTLRGHVVNDIWMQYRAERKGYQLEVARQCGLRIP